MRIAFFVSGFPEISETFIFNQIADLLKRGYSVDIYATHFVEKGLIHRLVQKHKLISKAIFLNELPSGRMAKMKLLIFKALSKPSFLVFFMLLRMFKKRANSSLSIYHLSFFFPLRHYDIVHAHFATNGIQVSKLKEIGLFRNAKTITTFHGYDVEPHSYDESSYTYLFDNCDHFTVNSEYTKRKLLQIACPEHKIMTLPVGLDIELFKRNNDQWLDPNRSFSLLFVGRFTSFKAPDLFVRICESLVRRNKIKFRAVMVGEGELMDLVKDMVTDLNLSETVSILGSLSQEEIIRIMSSSDLFVYPGITYNGRAENQGLVIQEAQSMELPVLISDAGGMNEGMIDEETGFIIPEGEIELFADRIESLAFDEIKRKKMGLAGRNFVQDHFSVVHLNDKLIDLYQLLNDAYSHD